MKYLTCVVLTTAFTFLSIAAFGVDLPEFTIKNEGAKSFVLQLDRVLTQRVQIRILDAENSLLLSEAIKEKGPFAKKYNLSNLPNGRYTVEIEDAYSISYQPIEVFEKHLVIDDKLLKAIYKPVITATGKQVDLTFLQVEDAVTEIEITDDAGFGIFKDSIKDNGSITRRYNVAQLLPGEYTFRLSVNDKVYYRKFSVGGMAY
jgi:hypothetical protein